MKAKKALVVAAAALSMAGGAVLSRGPAPCEARIAGKTEVLGPIVPDAGTFMGECFTAECEKAFADQCFAAILTKTKAAHK